MQDAFGTVIWAVVILGGLAAVATLIGTAKLYDQIGRGGLSLNEDGPPKPEAGGAVARAERDEEIRQMLTARNARRAARGEAERDIETELAELTRPALDPALREEVREHVVARNARRVARGREPLDVEAEIERQLGQLSG